MIATKVRAQMGDGPNEVGLSRQHIMFNCEASLKRLQTDYIDLYQVKLRKGVKPFLFRVYLQIYYFDE